MTHLRSAWVLEDVLAILRARRSELQAMNVTAVAVFGSVARGDAGAKSDVDLLIEHSHPFSLLSLGGVQYIMAEALGTVVDVATIKGLRPAVRDKIMAEAVYAWRS